MNRAKATMPVRAILKAEAAATMQVHEAKATQGKVITPEVRVLKMRQATATMRKVRAVTKVATANNTTPEVRAGMKPTTLRNLKTAAECKTRNQNKTLSRRQFLPFWII